MRTHSNSNSIYLGRGAGKFLLEDIKSAKKSVKVVSPYLSPSYVEELVKLHRKGVDVMLITSDQINEGDGNHSDLQHTDLIKQEQITDEVARERRDRGKAFSLASLLLLVVYFLLPVGASMRNTLVVLTLLSAGITYLHFNSIPIYSYRYYPLFKLRVFHSPYHQDVKGKFLVHSKVYVVDDRVAYLGSVNFTHAAIKWNYESCIKVEDSQTVRRISGEVDRLFGSKDLYAKPIEEWGRELYTESPT